MRHVLRSIKPYWVYLILKSKKTVEVGKNIPKAEDWSKYIYIYCSKDLKSFNRIPKEDREWFKKYLGTVVGRFFCPEIGRAYWTDIDGEDGYLLPCLGDECLTYDELLDYGQYADLFLYKISNLEMFEYSKNLKFFGLEKAPQSWCYIR